VGFAAALHGRERNDQRGFTGRRAIPIKDRRGAQTILLHRVAAGQVVVIQSDLKEWSNLQHAGRAAVGVVLNEALIIQGPFQRRLVGEL